MDYIKQFIDFCGQCGISPANSADIKDTGQEFKRFQIADERRGKKSARYRLVIESDYAWGIVIDSREGSTWHKFHSKISRKFTDEERRAYAKKRKEESAAHDARIKRRQAIVAKWSNVVWSKSKPASHVYIERKGLFKGISPIGCRVWGNRLIIPIYDAGKIVNLQLISEDGFKRPMLGGKVKGCYSSLNTGNDFSEIYIVEGFATGASVWESTGKPVIISFNAGNLKDVGEYIRGKYPKAKIVFAADNDQWTIIRGSAYNVGIEKATLAAESINASVIFPPFSKDDETKPTDWNDYFVRHGKEQTYNEIQQQVKLAVRGGEESPDDVVVVAQDLTPPPYLNEAPPLDIYDGQVNDLPQAINAIAGKDFFDKDSLAKLQWAKFPQAGDRGKKKLNNLTNCLVYLREHPDFSGVFRFDRFSKEIILHRCPFWEDETKFKIRRLCDNDILYVVERLEKYAVDPTPSKVHEAIQVVAGENWINPPLEYFERIKWDGVPRLGTWLTDYMGAIGHEADYLSAVGSRWLIGGVARIYKPGAKMDTMLVFEGIQGIKKSTALATLANIGKDSPESYFCDGLSFSQIKQKDTVQILQGKLIVEFAELASLKGRDVEEVKSWISNTVDEIRRPYGRITEKFPRQFLLSGSTNKPFWMKDVTGNRRFWPVKCSEATDIAGLAAVVEQLWAEAVHRYKAGEKWWIDRDEKIWNLAEDEQKARVAADLWESMVEKSIAGKKQVTVGEIADDMGILTMDRHAGTEEKISNILTQLGWERSVGRVNGKVSRGWKKATSASKPESVPVDDEVYEEVVF